VILAENALTPLEHLAPQRFGFSISTCGFEGRTELVHGVKCAALVAAQRASLDFQDFTEYLLGLGNPTLGYQECP
jgi:hypothetical protein